MDCNQIDENMLDEVVMGRSRDAELITHFGTCLRCSRRLVDHHAWVEDLQRALEELATAKSDRLMPARSHRSHPGAALEARFVWVQHTQADRQRTEDHIARLQVLAARIGQIEREIDVLVADTKWTDPSVVEMIQILRNARRAPRIDR
jgi:hypothetical protein